MPADQLNEIWDLYNYQLQLVGHQRRASPVKPGRYHLVVNAFLFNPAGQVLLQQRSPNKLYFPGYWDTSAGGSVRTGETIEQAMQHELAEELGVHYRLTPSANYRIVPHSHWIDAWFALKTTHQVTDFTLQKAELQRVAYFDVPQAVTQLQQPGFNSYRLELHQAWTHLHRLRPTTTVV